MSVCPSACVCVCVSVIISSELHVRSSPISVHVFYGRGSVMFRRRNDVLCTSGFYGRRHKPTLLDVTAQLMRSAHAALGLAINCAQ